MSEPEIPKKIIHRDLGTLSYALALNEQHHCHQSVVDGGAPYILTVQHPNVLTLGKNSTENNFLFEKEQISSNDFEIFKTDRGGEVTAHMPGQLVVYPILPIVRLNLTPKKYVEKLEKVVIETLKDLGIESTRDPDFPGVWVKNKKICAVGVRISSRVSMHGIALNINNDFSLFDRIIPCGIKNRGVTSASQELNTWLSVLDVQEKLLLHFQNEFKIKLD